LAHILLVQQSPQPRVAQPQPHFQPHLGRELLEQFLGGAGIAATDAADQVQESKARGHRRLSHWPGGDPGRL
jgi:hypothetical protein